MSDQNKETDPESVGDQNAEKEAESQDSDSHEAAIETTVTSNNSENAEGDNELPQIDSEVIERLSFGLLEKSLPDLQKAKSVLNDVLQNQGILIDSIQQENAKFDDCKAMTELNETMLQARKYHSKLMALKKEMNNLTDKSFKLKKRALKLQQQKQKEELQRVQQLDRDQERERALEARVAKPSPSNAV